MLYRCSTTTWITSDRDRVALTEWRELPPVHYWWLLRCYCTCRIHLNSKCVVAIWGYSGSHRECVRTIYRPLTLGMPDSGWILHRNIPGSGSSWDCIKLELFTFYVGKIEGWFCGEFDIYAHNRTRPDDRQFQSNMFPTHFEVHNIKFWSLGIARLFFLK